MERIAGWLRLIGRFGWQLGGVAIVVFVIWTIFQRLLLLILTIFVALLIAALLTPLSRWIERAGIPRSIAAVIAVLGGTLVLLGVGALLVMQIVGQADELAQQFEQVLASVETWLTAGPLKMSAQQIDMAIDRVNEAVRGNSGAIANQALGFVVAVGSFLTAIVLAFFLVRDADRINDWILMRLVSDGQRDVVSAAGGRAGDALRGYITGTVIIGVLDALFIGIALVVLGVPLAAPLAVLTFIGAFFPVVGAFVAGLLATLFAAVSGGLTTGLIVLGVVIAVQQIDANVFQPVIMGKTVHLHPIVVLAALTAGGLLAGLAGAFMAVPTAAVLVAVGTELRQERNEQAPFADRADGT